MNKDTVLKIENVSKSFPALIQSHDSLRAYFWEIFKRKTPEEKAQAKERFWAIRDINFEVKRGDFYGIIGRNGSGKSTLLKIIAGIYQPDTGGVAVDGHLIPFLELGVGFNPNLTAKENVFLNGIILGMTRKEVEEKYEEIFEFAELKEFENLQLKKFSSGMQVRLAFAVAIQAHGDIYLLDEVFAVGDMGFQQKALAKIEEMIADGKTIIYVGHGMETMEKYATNILYIKDHHVAGIGREMIAEYVKDITGK